MSAVPKFSNAKMNTLIRILKRDQYTSQAAWENALEYMNTKLDEALENRKHFNSNESWARATAYVFYYGLGEQVWFVNIYTDLLNVCDKYYVDLTVDEGTDDKGLVDKKKLNRILYKEYEDWYGPIEREVYDEYKLEGDDYFEDFGSMPNPTFGEEEVNEEVQNRWILHTLKVASRRLKKTKEELKESVEEWLDKRLEKRGSYCIPLTHTIDHY
jgi:hypothetical protein